MYFVPCTPRGVSRWTQRTALDGADFTLTFRWSQRDGHWLLDVADAESVAIITGVCLVPNIDLLDGVIDTRRPPGKLAILDTTGALDADPGFSDIGTPGDEGVRFVLVYFEAAELVTLAAEYAAADAQEAAA